MESCVLFFFKQNAAYEMRISDWSSDVCSSDLFDKASGKFDLVLLSGEKIRDRLAQAELLKDDGHAIVGYPKFDLPPRTGGPRLFPKDRPTVLYNPHPSPALSSWYEMGPQILDWFAAQDRYNLILAPHVLLFKKRVNASLSPFTRGWTFGPRSSEGNTSE